MAKQIKQADIGKPLKETKQEILDLLSENSDGLTPRQLSEELGITPDSVRKQLKDLQNKEEVIRIKRAGNQGDLFLDA